MSEIPLTAARTWSAVLVVAALALVIGGRAGEDFRPLPSGAIPEDLLLPVPETPSGEVPAPPTTFRWKPGNADRDFGQVTLFHRNFEPFWSSAPTKATEIVVDPAEVFVGIAAGEQLFWRVREVRDGKPLVTSKVELFTLALDLEGRPEGESVSERPPRRGE